MRRSIRGTCRGKRGPSGSGVQKGALESHKVHHLPRSRLAGGRGGGDMGERLYFFFTQSRGGEKMENGIVFETKPGEGGGREIVSH